MIAEISLLERYKLAVGEYRFAVVLGSARQLVFVLLNPLILALGGTRRAELLVLAACASLAGVVIVRLSHDRYKRTRSVLLERARELGVAGDWQTTGGMREAHGEPPSEGLGVAAYVALLLLLYVALDVVALVALILG